MQRFFATIVLGALLATLGEYLFCVLVRHSVPDYLFTLGAYPVILALAWMPMRWVERHVHGSLRRDVAIYLLAGLTGLAIEWFLIGNSPWANPEANDLGMFCFWAVVLAMPRLLLDRRAYLRRVQLSATLSFLIYAGLALIIGFATPEPLRLFVLVWTVVIGYAGMNLFFAHAFLLEWRHSRRSALLAPEPLGA